MKKQTFIMSGTGEKTIGERFTWDGITLVIHKGHGCAWAVSELSTGKKVFTSMTGTNWGYNKTQTMAMAKFKLDCHRPNVHRAVSESPRLNP